MPPMEKDPQREQEFLDSVPARYLVIASFEYLVIDQRYAQPMVEKYPDNDLTQDVRRHLLVYPLDQPSREEMQQRDAAAP